MTLELICDCMPDHVKELRDDFGNLALVIGDENSGKPNRPLHEWLATRSPEYLKRHFIPTDQSLWHMEKYENFLIERRKAAEGPDTAGVFVRRGSRWLSKSLKSAG